jgi:hypothetical protein
VELSLLLPFKPFKQFKSFKPFQVSEGLIRWQADRKRDSSLLLRMTLDRSCHPESSSTLPSSKITNRYRRRRTVVICRHTKHVISEDFGENRR